jgi:hypothetical protein
MGKARILSSGKLPWQIIRWTDRGTVSRVRVKPVRTDIEVYVECMQFARSHRDKAEAIFARTITAGDQELDADLIYVQLRKALELIVFASLSANRERYAAAREGFATEWSAKRMLGNIRKINPHFYPVPFRITASVPYQPDVQLEKEFLTEEQFIELYDQASKVLHFPNPFSPDDYSIDLTVEVPKWACLVRQLLEWHVMSFVDDDREGWFIHVPKKGEVRCSHGGPPDSPDI